MTNFDERKYFANNPGKITAGLQSRQWTMSYRRERRNHIRAMVFHKSQPDRACPENKSGDPTMVTSPSSFSENKNLPFLEMERTVAWCPSFAIPLARCSARKKAPPPVHETE
jgi:hypothetical protein